MNEKIKYILIAILLLIGLYVLNNAFKKGEAPVSSDYKNIEYTIAGQKIKLINGSSEVESAPGSSSKTITKYFGNELKKDLDGDGREDVAFLLTQNSGGSGTFFYLAGALNKESGWTGTEAVFIGDRIAPQTTDSGEGRIVIVNYADRKPGESFSTQPSQGKSLYLLLDPKNLQFGEVVQNFEGEADPSRMTLGMKKWIWIDALYNDGTKIVPKEADKFSLTFSSDGKFSATTDCNSMSGQYTTNQSAISLGNIASTKMYCEGSQEADFLKLLNQASSYHFTSKGELVFDLKYDSGIVIFR